MSSNSKNISSMMDGNTESNLWFLVPPELCVFEHISLIPYMEIPIPFPTRVSYDDSLDIPTAKLHLYFYEKTYGTFYMTMHKEEGGNVTDTAYKSIEISPQCNTIYLSTEFSQTQERLRYSPYNRIFAVKKNSSLHGDWVRKKPRSEEFNTLDNTFLLKTILLKDPNKISIDSINSITSYSTIGHFMYKLYYYYEKESKFVYKLTIGNQTQYIAIELKYSDNKMELYAYSKHFNRFKDAIEATKNNTLQYNIYLAERDCFQLKRSSLKRKYQTDDSGEGSSSSKQKAI